MRPADECYISVDVEASGPIPGEYSMLALGACVVGRRDATFYVEFRPLNDNAVAKAIAVSNLDLGRLSRDGDEAGLAMCRFKDWVVGTCGAAKPVFVGFNAAFDWSFVNWYFHKFLGENPFGFAPADIKSYYMGLTGSAWKETTSSQLPERFRPSHPGDHNALNDAIAQADIFEKLLAEHHPE